MEPLSAIFMYTKAGHREEKGDEFIYERRKSLAARNFPAARLFLFHKLQIKVKTTPKKDGLTRGLEGRKTSQRLNDAGLNFVQTLVV